MTKPDAACSICGGTTEPMRMDKRKQIVCSDCYVAWQSGNAASTYLNEWQIIGQPDAGLKRFQAANKSPEDRTPQEQALLDSEDLAQPDVQVVQRVTFTYRNGGATGLTSGYGCNLPGDQDGEYVRAKDYEALLAQLETHLNESDCTFVQQEEMETLLAQNAALKDEVEELGKERDELKHRLTEEIGMGIASSVLHDEETASLTQRAEAAEKERADLAMLVLRLCASKSETVKAQAMDYLVRKGLQGSILREEKQS